MLDVSKRNASSSSTGSGNVLTYVNPYPIPTIEQQACSIEDDERETLYICPNAWALRHRFVNRETGEMIRARCDSWRCLYCGPRKVDQWRQLIRAAEPVLFVTLTKVGWTVEQAARVLTTVVQRLRRGYKDTDRKGYRDAYPIEYFAVLERHSNFEENGFHWHLLVKGVDFLPKQIVSDALRSATGGRSFIVDVERIRNTRAIGYVTKYLTKQLTHEEKGVTVQEREMLVITRQASPERTKVITGYDEQGNPIVEERPYLYIVQTDEQGNPVKERVTVEVEKMSTARRIRYSRGFFPESVKALRARLFSGIQDSGEIGIEQGAAPALDITVEGEQSSDHPIVRVQESEENEQAETDEEEPQTGWALVEMEPFTDKLEVYRERKRRALREVLTMRREQGKRLNRRILSMWDYQHRERHEGRSHERRMLRLAS